MQINSGKSFIFFLPFCFHCALLFLNFHNCHGYVTRSNFLMQNGVSDVQMSSKTAGLSEKKVIEIRRDFPVLFQEAHPDKPLIYLDNAATSQKPRQVLEVLNNYYAKDNSNVHRGAHALASRATEAYEASRDKVQKFINAESRNEIVWTRGATEAINLVANSWGEKYIEEGDEIILSVMEHHSNLVPWQILAQRKKAQLKFVQLTEDEQFDLEHFNSLLSDKTKLVAINHASNTLGCVNPVKDVIEAAHKRGAKVLLDACQSVPNMPVDVQDLDCDWLCASGHKMCGPTGIGFLYGKMDVLRSMPPWMGGGEMIDDVFFEHSTFADVPARFEAGTPAIAQVVGLGAAVDYLTELGIENIEAYEHELCRYLFDHLEEIPDMRIYGPRPDSEGKGRNALAAFNVENIHASDLSFFLDQEGVAVRAGHHCTQPLHRMLGAAGSCRASLYFYNTKSDIDAFIRAYKETVEMFAGFS
mmetsp:Transcript_37821/g.47725  ORF Transcript_37821/g.47725 Transcript_37821/m.47725 type:complete len:472 (+) Transcript_37821:111-1526(+)